jgi:N-methylhydantoinase A
MRYARQLHDLRVPVPGRGVDAAFADAVRQAFIERCAALYGASAVLKSLPVRMLRVGVEAVGLIDKPVLPLVELDKPDPSAAEERARSIYWPEARRRLPTRVYDGRRLKSGNEVEGPAVIELPGTTVALPPGDHALVDRYGNTVISIGGARPAR